MITLKFKGCAFSEDIKGPCIVQKYNKMFKGSTVSTVTTIFRAEE
jgi:hypothetical protein